MQLQARDRTTYLCMRHYTWTPAVSIFGGVFEKFARSLLCAHIVLTDPGISDFILWVTFPFGNGPSKNSQVALWNQRSSKRPDVGNLVVWDYHVILVLRERIRAATTAEPTQAFYPTNNAGDDEEVHHIDNPESRSRETPGWMSGHGMLGHTVTTEDGETSVKTQTDTSYDDDYNCSQPQRRKTAHESPEPIAWVYDLDGCAEVPCPFDGE